MNIYTFFVTVQVLSYRLQELLRNQVAWVHFRVEGAYVGLKFRLFVEMNDTFFANEPLYFIPVMFFDVFFPHQAAPRDLATIFTSDVIIGWFP